MKVASEREKWLIEAMSVRYTKDTTQRREKLNLQYSEAMHKAYVRFQADPEISSLYADALMILHPWNLWKHDGTPQPWTNEIASVLEKTLKIAPDHPGANHYYIHTVEASPFPGKAKASADRLSSLAPGVAHMVHMPSHIYIRTGQYAKGAKVNEDALKQYNNYLLLYPEVKGNAALYDFHNRHMKAACSMNGDNYPKALKDAMFCQKGIDTSLLFLPAPMGSFIQYVYTTPLFTLIKFQRWKEILEQPVAVGNYAALLEHFGRGMAYANLGQVKLAKTSLQHMQVQLKEDELAVPMAPFNSAKDAGLIAEQILLGTISEKQGLLKEASEHYMEAVKREDALIYNEPKDWLLPARHYLGTAYLKMQNYAAAEEVFREDLRINPLNTVSLKGFDVARKRNTKYNKSTAQKFR
jgi:tetratricopeptide (TPR) repeat protein